MEWSNECAHALSQLDELEGYESFSPFCRAFYRLIAEEIDRSPTYAQEFYRIFSAFLEGEISHHHALRVLGVDSSDCLPEWAELCSSKASGLHKTLAQLVAFHVPAGAPAVVKHLLCSECFHQLGRPDLVVLGMQAAIHQGCDHPLIFFALGYNIYMRALKQFTSFDPATCRQVVDDPLNFQQMCDHAVGALRRGACGSPYDAQLYWWIGCILENVGARGEAWAAYQQVAELDPITYAEVLEEKLKFLVPPVPEALSEEERDRLAVMSEITVDEILDAFRDVESIADLMEQSPRLKGGTNRSGD